MWVGFLMKLIDLFCNSQCQFPCLTDISSKHGDEGVVQMDLGPETNC